jgi:hypothetical protein
MARRHDMRAARGAAYLDRTAPREWPDRVDADRIYLYDDSGCVVGQATGSYTRHVRLNSDREPGPCRPFWNFRHGFLPAPWGHDAQAAAWGRLIRARQAALAREREERESARRAERHRREALARRRPIARRLWAFVTRDEDLARSA